MERIEKIYAILEKNNIQGAIITSRENIRWIAPSVIDNSIILVDVKNGIQYITDSRYEKQATDDFKDKSINIHITSTPDVITKALELANQAGFKQLMFEDRSCSYTLYNSLNDGFKGELIKAGDSIDTLRRSKDKPEIENIKTSLEIAQQSLEETFNAVRVGMKEREVEALLTYNLLKNGSENGVFGIVAVSGENSALPHGRAGERTLRQGDFLLIDFGAIYKGYYSDITRTVAIGSASEEMNTVYNTVLGANLAGIEAIHNGVATKAVDRAARDYIAMHGYGEYFVHGLGHGLGLDIHEQPRLSKASTELIKAGDVVTVEPGIYIPNKFGVRIEDVILVEENDKIILTSFPKELRIIGE